MEIQVNEFVVIKNNTIDKILQITELVIKAAADLHFIVITANVFRIHKYSLQRAFLLIQLFFLCFYNISAELQEHKMPFKKTRCKYQSYPHLNDPQRSNVKILESNSKSKAGPPIHHTRLTILVSTYAVGGLLGLLRYQGPGATATSLPPTATPI